MLLGLSGCGLLDNPFDPPDEGCSSNADCVELGADFGFIVNYNQEENLAVNFAHCYLREEQLQNGADIECKTFFQRVANVNHSYLGFSSYNINAKKQEIGAKLIKLEFENGGTYTLAGWKESDYSMSGVDIYGLDWYRKYSEGIITSLDANNTYERLHLIINVESINNIEVLIDHNRSVVKDANVS